MRNLGKIGEKNFDLWCSKADLTCNKSNEDETGWDYSVEFPLDLSRPGALSHDSAIECKVQVKTTQTTKPSTQIKVSNLHRFASSPLPCFIVLFICGQEKKITDVYVRHIDEELISAIIEKTLKHRVADDINMLHKNEMVIRFRRKDRLKSLSPAALRDALATPVKHGMHNYSKTKQDYLALCGYADKSVTGRMTFIDESDVEKFIDMMLGYGGSVPVQNLKISRKRFDIEEVVPTNESDTAVISIDKSIPPHEAVLRITKGPFETPVTFPASVYLPSFIDNIPNNLIALRVSTRIIDIKIKPYLGSGQFDIELDLDDTYDLLELRNSLWLLKQLASAEPLSIEIQSASNDTPPLKGFVRGKKQNLVLDETLEGLDAALKLVNHLGVTERIRLTLEQAQLQSLGLVQAYSLFQHKNPVMRIEFTTNTELNEKKEYVCPWVVQIPLGDMLITIVVTLIGLPVKIKELRYQFSSNKPVVSQSFVQSTGNILTDEERRTLISDAQRKYESKYEIITLQP